MTNYKDEKALHLKNYMEQIVFNYIDNLIKMSPYCTCPLCRMDIAAYALNHLPPKYIVSEKGEIYSKLLELQQQFEVDITITVMKAIQVVGTNPKHPIAQDGDSDEE